MVDSDTRARPVVWFEIAVRDFDRAAGFYHHMFGWSFEPFEEYSSDYRLLRGVEGGMGGALIPAAPSLVPAGAGVGNGTIVFIHVADLEAAMNKALELGGELVQPARLITAEAGRFAYVRDLDGNVLGLWAP